MAVTDETEAQVRADREKAEEYGRKVLAGEAPWKDEEGDVNDTAPDGGPVENAPEVAGDTVKNDDVGETDSDAPDAIEVDEAEIDKPTE